MDPVSLAIDGGLLEAERVDEEADEGPGVADPQRGPYLRCWSLVIHAASVPVATRRWLGNSGTPRRARWWASSQRSNRTPGPGVPDRSNRRTRRGRRGRATAPSLPAAAVRAWPGQT